MVELLLIVGILLLYVVVLITSVRSKAPARVETSLEQMKRMRTEDYWNNPVVNELRRNRDGKR